MFRWTPYPMVRVVSFFVAGILVGYSYPNLIAPSIVAFIFAGLLLSFGLVVDIGSRAAWHSSFRGTIIVLLVVVAGYWQVLSSTNSRRPDHLSQFTSAIDHYLARVSSPPELRSGSIRYETDVIRVHTKAGWTNVHGRVQIYLAGISPDQGPHYGDQLVIKGSPVVLSSPMNPGEFDYKAFMRLKNITHQHFIRQGDFKETDQHSSPGILDRAQQVRSMATGIIDQFVTSQRNRSVLKALILGVTDGIDNELEGAYAASGTLHVLSVSGLHVGIIYGLLLFLLRPLASYPWSRWLVAGLSLTCLWAYAVVTGLSPSVLRAVTMFSFVALARLVARDTNVFNTLAASAFLLLLFDPFLVLSVGFQLSYAAMIGILYLQRPLYLLWEMESPLADKVWQLASMSLAAQLTTFPLGLYYFHQFPLYFMFSNLVVIPLSSMALISGIVLLIVHAVPWLSAAVAYVANLIVSLLNAIVLWVEALPFSTINGVTPTGLQCLVLLGMVVTIVALFETRQFKFVVAFSVLVALFSWIELSKAMSISALDQLVVYRLKGGSAMAWNKGSASHFMADSSLSADKIRFHVFPARLLAGTKVVLPWHGAGHRAISLFMAGPCSIAWIKRPLDDLPLRGTASILVISHDAVRSLTELAQRIKFERVILDGTNSPRGVTRLLAEARVKNILVHSVMTEGAFVLNL